MHSSAELNSTISILRDARPPAPQEEVKTTLSLVPSDSKHRSRKLTAVQRSKFSEAHYWTSLAFQSRLSVAIEWDVTLVSAFFTENNNRSMCSFRNGGTEKCTKMTIFWKLIPVAGVARATRLKKNYDLQHLQLIE
jgi:hypothetical protein